MMFKNSIRLLSANFAEVWKLLVYHILSIAVCVGLLAIFHGDYIKFFNIAYEESGLVSVFETGTLLGTGNIASALTKVANFAVFYLWIMFASNIWLGIYFLFVFLSIGNIIFFNLKKIFIFCMVFCCII